MHDKGRAFLAASLIMLFLLGTSLFVGTASTKASQRVKSIVESEVNLPPISNLKKQTFKKPLPKTISGETSIKNVSW